MEAVGSRGLCTLGCKSHVFRARCSPDPVFQGWSGLLGWAGWGHILHARPWHYALALARPPNPDASAPQAGRFCCPALPDSLAIGCWRQGPVCGLVPFSLPMLAQGPDQPAPSFDQQPGIENNKNIELGPLQNGVFCLSHGQPLQNCDRRQSPIRGLALNTS